MIDVFKLLLLSSSLAAGDTVTPSRVRAEYPAIFRAVRMEEGGAAYYSVDVDSLPPSHPLADAVNANLRFLTYLAVNGIHPELPTLLAGEPSAEVFTRSYQAVIQGDTLFNAAVIPTLVRYQAVRDGAVGSLAPRPSVTMEDALNVAVRFIYPDAIRADGTIQTHICVGSNGMRDFPGARNLALEAFAYSAMMGEVRTPKHGLMEEFLTVKRAMEAMPLSADTTTRLARAQGMAWGRMIGSSSLRRVLLEEYRARRDYLPFVIRDADAVAP